VDKKKKVLFVGSFKEMAKDGSVGGQMFACKSLISSELSSEFDWILLDTTGESVPPPPVYIRFFFAIKRIFIFIYFLILHKPHSILIFTANTPSIFEKGLMAIIGSFFSKNIIIAPRGGPLDLEIKNNKWIKIFVKFVFNKSNYIICQGQYWKSFFSKLLDESSIDKFIVVPNWIDIKNYDISKCDLKDDRIIRILYMGWIQEDKGVHDIFSAIEHLSIENIQVEFIFLGDGASRQYLINYTKSTKMPFLFSFPGWVHGQEKLAYLANSDIFILASHSEGLPNSLMEAMLCGIPSIATDVGSVSDLIINGETGILIEKKNIKQLTQGIQDLVLNENLRNSYSFEGRKRILSNHSIHSAIKSFKKILQ
jgi:glycosyltransferase involved in cell wall biosynthesis